MWGPKLSFSEQRAAQHLRGAAMLGPDGGPGPRHAGPHSAQHHRPRPGPSFPGPPTPQTPVRLKKRAYSLGVVINMTCPFQWTPGLPVLHCICEGTKARFLFSVQLSSLSSSRAGVGWSRSTVTCLALTAGGVWGSSVCVTGGCDSPSIRYFYIENSHFVN